MKKGRLIKQIDRFTSRTYFTLLFREFLATDKIKKLGDHKHIYFTDYLYFVQKHLLDNHWSITPSELFTEPYLQDNNHKEEIKFIKKFISEIKTKPVINHRHELKYKFHKTKAIKSPASALAIMPNGNILIGTCCFDEYGVICGGQIVLRDPFGQFIKTLVDEPASALAIMPNGNILSGICRFDLQGNHLSGEIVLRDSSGQCIQKLADEPASALTIMPDGNILSGTCSFDEYGVICDGQIVLRDSFGQFIKTLVDEPASALAIMPNGKILSGTCSYDGFAKICEGEIVLRDSSGQRIQTLAYEPASALNIMPDGRVLSGICYSDFFNNDFISVGVINFNNVKLIKEKKPTITMQERINELLIDNAALACLQFHKGIVESTSLVSLLPLEILRIIYSYVFPFPNMITEKIVNSNCFVHHNKNDVKQFSTANLFANKICGIKFFEQTYKKHDIESTEENVKRNNKCVLR